MIEHISGAGRQWRDNRGGNPGPVDQGAQISPVDLDRPGLRIEDAKQPLASLDQIVGHAFGRILAISAAKSAAKFAGRLATIGAA